MNGVRPAPGWAAEVEQWGRGLFAVERHPLALRLAARGTLGLMVPLLAGLVLSWPSLNVAALAAFLLAFGDLTEDRGWLPRLAAGSALGALSAASGVLAGAHPATAALAMLGWGTLLGVAGVYGDGAAAIALPVAWAFIEIGLPATDRGIGEAVARGALFLAGGAWAIALAWAMRIARRNRPLAERAAECYERLGEYLAHACGVGAVVPAARNYRPSDETRVRSAITDARALAVETRRRQAAASRPVQRLVVLIELADRIFSLASVLAEVGVTPSATAPPSADGAEPRPTRAHDGAEPWPLAEGARAVARVTLDRAGAAAVAPIAAGLERAGESPAPGGAVPSTSASAGTARDRREEIHRAIARALVHALRAAGGDRLPATAEVPADADSRRRTRSLAALLAPLSAVADRRSVVARHALRYGVVTAAAVAIDAALAPRFGYWIPLTATVILKPYAGSTLTRAGQRLCGTIAGVAVGVALVQIPGGPAAWGLASGAAFGAAIAVLPLNYALTVFFLSAGIVPFESLVYGATEWGTGLLRVLDTVIGGALALAGGYLLWPSFERRSLSAMLAAAVASTATYADRVLGHLAGDAAPDLEATHRRAGLDNTNLQASFQRVVAEPGAAPGYVQATFVAVVALQRLMLSLNALRELSEGAGSAPEWQRLRERVRRGLGDLPAALASPAQSAAAVTEGEAASIARALTRPAGAGLSTLEADRVAWQVDTLRDAVGRMGGAEREAQESGRGLG